MALVPKEDQRSSVRLVSRTFFNIVGWSQFNIGVIVPSEVEQFVRVFGRYQKPIGLTFNKPNIEHALNVGGSTLKKTQKLGSDDIRRILALTQLTSLHIDSAIDSSILTQLSNLVSLKVGENGVVTMSALHHLSKLTSLEAELTGDVADTALLSKLMTLHLTNKNNSWSNLTCPNVTFLTIQSPTSPPQEWLAKFKPKTVNIQNVNRFTASPHLYVPTGSWDHLTSLSVDHISIQNKDEVPWHQLKQLSLNFTRKSMDSSALTHVSKCTSLTSLNVTAVTNQDMVDSVDVREMKHLRAFTMLIGGFPPFGSVKNLLQQFNKDTLRSLWVTVYHDHEDCFIEISKMTKLERLNLYVRNTTLDYEPYDLSVLMTLTQLTSLMLRLGRYIGLKNLSNMTKLNSLRITRESPDHPLDKLSLSAFTNLTDLELTQCVNVVDIRGATQLQRLVYHAPDKSKSGIELVPDELRKLKEISIGTLANPIPWPDIAKFTALESILTDTFDMDDSISTLQNLKRLTLLGNRTMFTKSVCNHFDANHLAHLTQLQQIELIVPSKGSYHT